MQNINGSYRNYMSYEFIYLFMPLNSWTYMMTAVVIHNYLVLYYLL